MPHTIQKKPVSKEMKKEKLALDIDTKIKEYIKQISLVPTNNDPKEAVDAPESEGQKYKTPVKSPTLVKKTPVKKDNLYTEPSFRVDQNNVC